MGLLGRVRIVRTPMRNYSHYMHSEELSSFTDQPDVITHVALVKPKPGVFIDEITSLLVICTPVSVLLLGVSSTPSTTNHSGHREIKLYATEMSVQTEVEMTSVIGTPDGRIFMCGLQDGSLYELHYQEKEGWFGKRVQLINHSVGGVQSFLPKFSATRPDGEISIILLHHLPLTCHRSYCHIGVRPCEKLLLYIDCAECYLSV